MESSDPKDNQFGISASDLELITDCSFFVKKTAFMSKVQLMFANIEQQISDIQLINLPMEVYEAQRGKITQGEKYLGAPWMVLDKPAYFSGKDIFAYRQIFLWGQSFSTTFHLSGQFVNRAKGKDLKKLYGKNRFLLTGPDPFVHHYNEHLHVAIEEVDDDTIELLPYFKVVEFTSFANLASFPAQCANFMKDVDAFLTRKPSTVKSR